MSFVKCPKCSQQLNLSNVQAGSVVQCPCGARLRTPKQANPSALSSLPPIDSTGDIPTSSKLFVKLGNQVHGPFEKPVLDSVDLSTLIRQRCLGENRIPGVSDFQVMVSEKESGPFRLQTKEDLIYDHKPKSKATMVLTILFTVINFVFFASYSGESSLLVSLLFGICTSALIAISGCFFYYFPNFAKPIFPSVQKGHPAALVFWLAVSSMLGWFAHNGGMHGVQKPELTLLVSSFFLIMAVLQHLGLRGSGEGGGDGGGDGGGE